MSDPRLAQIEAPRVFLDLDGVLADFDGYYAFYYGQPTPRALGQPDSAEFWDRIERHGQFYRVLPLMPGALQLYYGVWALTGERPTILTGIPHSVTDVERHKREWVAEHIDASASVICCKSAEKRLHMKPGDVLIDDWEKYAGLWRDAGGVFIVHRSADESLNELRRQLSRSLLDALADAHKERDTLKAEVEGRRIDAVWDDEGGGADGETQQLGH